jgi:hypothetical protein
MAISFSLANCFRSIIQRGFLSQFQPLKFYAVAPDLCKVVLRLLHKPGKTLEMSRALRAAAAILLFTATPTSAHHAFAAEYDANTLVMISGIVAKFEWTNPHALLYLGGRDAEGKAGAGSPRNGQPGGLVSRGWKKTDLKNGDQITVDGFAAKDGRNVANVRTVKLADGRKLFGGLQSTPGNPFK